MNENSVTKSTEKIVFQLLHDENIRLGFLSLLSTKDHWVLFISLFFHFPLRYFIDISTSGRQVTNSKFPAILVPRAKGNYNDMIAVSGESK